jgi:hypothetical protein
MGGRAAALPAPGYQVPDRLVLDDGRCVVRFTTEDGRRGRDYDFARLPLARPLQVTFARAFDRRTGPAGTRKSGPRPARHPALQIYPGTGMTCVFDPSKAKCRLTSQDDTRRTPDLTDCQPGCQNIARTDRDIEHVRQQASELADLVNDPLSPTPRHERERHELARLHAILNDHQATRPNPETTT